MSLKAKFEEIKEQTKIKETKEEIKGGKETLGEIRTKKEELIAKISILKDSLNKLDSAYYSAQDGVEEFKSSKDKINELFNEYSEDLKKQGIDSVSGILNNKDFSGDEEVINYHRAGTGKFGRKDERGELGKRVESLAETKTKAKEEFPELGLNFRGGVKEGEEISPREESLEKMRELINKLENEDLKEIVKKEKIAKAEYLPKVKEIVKKEIEDIFPKGNEYSTAPYASDFNFISNEVFSLCGDEMWPEVKEAAEEAIRDSFKGKNNLSAEEIGASLEAEKLIFDVQNLKSEHGEVLKLNEDHKELSMLKSDIESTFHGNEIFIKDSKIHRADLLQKAEYFKQKNPEAKLISEEAKKEAIDFLSKIKEEVNPGLFTGGKTRKDMEAVKQEINNSIDKLTKLDVPEIFFGPNCWGFSNSVHNSFPSFKGYQYDWFSSLNKKIEEKRGELVSKIQKPLEDEGDSFHRFNDELYNGKIFGGVSSLEGGSQVPAYLIKDDYHYKKIIDKEEIDKFLESISGKNLTEEEFNKEFDKELKVFEEEIKSYPGSDKILERFESLLKKYDTEFFRKSMLINNKMKPRGSKVHKHGYRDDETDRESYKVKQELFYSAI